MSEPHHHDHGSEGDEIAELRSRIAQSPPGSLEWRWYRGRLAEELLDTAAAAVDAADTTDTDGTDGTTDWAAGTDGVAVLRALVEPETILDSLRATGPGAGEYRSLCERSAWAAAIRYAITESPQDLDTLIGWWERAAADTPGEEFAADDPWWEESDSARVRCALAIELARRWELTPSGHRRPDADRIVDLLTPLLAPLLDDAKVAPAAATAAGPAADADAATAAGPVADPALCHACLGLVLSDRSRGPDHADPERLADRAAALVHLRAAHAHDDLDADLRHSVAFDLAALAHEDWSDRRDAAPHAYGPDRDAAELGPLLDLLRPLLDDRGEAGGRAAELGGDIADSLCMVAADRTAQCDAIAWYRAARAHPGLDPAAGVRIGANLALALLERAERNDEARTAGEPDPDADRAEALALLDNLLDVMEPDDEDRLSCLTTVVELLWRRLNGPDHAAAVDGVITRGEEVVRLIGPDDEDRALVVLRVALARGMRVHAEAEPHVQVLSGRLTQGADPAAVPPLDHRLPEVAAGLTAAVDLLRTATGLYGYEDELYLASVLLLGVLQIMEFALRLPEVRSEQLHEGMRRMRTALERLETGSELRSSDVAGVFLMGAMFTVWFTAPFEAAHADLGALEIPDVTGYASVEDDLQILDALLDAQGDDREPSYDYLRAMLLVVRSPGGLPSSDGLRTWQARLRRAADRTEVDAPAHKAMILTLSAAFGLELVNRGQASATAAAAATTALYDARALASPGTPLHTMIDGLLRDVGRTDPRGLLRFFQQSFRASAPGAPGAPDAPAEPEAPAAPGTAGTPRAPHPAYAPKSPYDRPPSPAAAAAPDAAVTASDAAGPTAPGAPAGRAGVRVDVRADVRAGAFESLELDLQAAVLVGDGSADPFGVPAGRAVELLTARTGALSTPATVALAMVRYQRWLRERDGEDLTAAVDMVGHAAHAAGAGRSAGPLAGRLAALQAGMLLDRHLLLGDHADLEAADRAYQALLRQVPPGVRTPPLATLLIEAAGPGEREVLQQLFVPPEAAEEDAFRAELLAAAGITGPLLARLRGPLGDPDAVPVALARLHEAERTLPDGHHRLPSVRSEIARHAFEQAGAASGRPDPAARTAAVAALLAAAASCPPAGPHRTALLLRAAAALCEADADPVAGSEAEEHAAAAPPASGTAGARATDAGSATAERSAPARLDEGIALLRQAVDDRGHPYHGARSRCLYGLGMLLCVRYRRAGVPADLDAATSALQEARLGLQPGRGDAFSIVLTRALALAYRAYGQGEAEQRRKSRDAARSVLAAHGRTVLLQTGAHRGLDAARAVGADMARLVRWCLADGLPELAVEAVELGRGLVLNAATVNATVPDLLRAAGHRDLAADWERTAGADPDEGPAVPDDLRRRVLTALTGSAAERRLLSAPTPAQVGRALRRVGADALVHLVPGDDGPGHALAVTATGVVRTLELPALGALDDGPLGAYNRALRAFQDAGRPDKLPRPTDPPVLHALHRRELEQKEKRWKQCLDDLSGWAGTAVMDDLLDHAARWWPGRTPRLVLAPVGPLGVVPWHAARCSGGTDPAARYAVQRAELSYCATARQLLEVAARPRTPLDTGTVLLVVDPAGSAAMQREGRLVRSLFHPEAVVVGGLGWRPERDGPWTGPAPLPATRAAIDAYLPGRGATSAALSHINCHADTGPTAAGSVLKLDRTNRLTVAHLLAGARERDPQAPGGVVVLANCTSDLALSDHDEALTLSTAVLAAGAAAVVGSRWAILDDPRTTLLMCLFHHRLQEGALPGEALRAAQLWMLDPGRVVPPELAELAARTPVSPETPWDELEIWASFTHHGR